MTKEEQIYYYSKLQTYLEKFDGDRFHEHYFILSYLIDKLNKNDVRYLEVGLWDGASFFYILQNEKVKDVVGIDIKFRDLLHQNLKKYGSESVNCKIIEKRSIDKSILNDINGKFDLIFIDGDHKYFSIVGDFNFYSKLVNDGGYLVFDDYMDKYSPDVKRAIDYMLKGDYFKDFEIIGSLEQHIPIYYDYFMKDGEVNKIYDSLGHLNNFILKKSSKISQIKPENFNVVTSLDKIFFKPNIEINKKISIDFYHNNVKRWNYAADYYKKDEIFWVKPFAEYEELVQDIVIKFYDDGEFLFEKRV